MTAAILLALLAGVLIGLSRQINGRLGLTSGALGASFWNHAVGFAALTLIALAAIGWTGLDAIRPALLAAADAPWRVYMAGPLGVAFVAGSSIAVLRIGAVRAATLIIAGQMLAGVALDVWRGTAGAPAATLLGVAIILAGVAIGNRRRL